MTFTKKLQHNSIAIILKICWWSNSKNLLLKKYGWNSVLLIFAQ